MRVTTISLRIATPAALPLCWRSSGCSRAPESAPVAAPAPAAAEAVRIAVDGAVNSGVSIAAAGNRAVVTWAATVRGRHQRLRGGQRRWRKHVRHAGSRERRRRGRTGQRRAAAARRDWRGHRGRVGLAADRRVTDQDGAIGRWWTHVRAGGNGTQRIADRRARLAIAGDRREQPGARGVARWARRQSRCSEQGCSTQARRDVRRRDLQPRDAPLVASGHLPCRLAAGQGARRRNQAIEARVATDVCFCCKTSVAIAPDGTSYVAFRHIYPTNLRDMAVARSIDGGRTFEAPVRVSEDQWQINACPEDGPSIAVACGRDAAHRLADADSRHRAAQGHLLQLLDRSRPDVRDRASVSMMAGKGAARPPIRNSPSPATTVAVVWDESASQGRQVRFAEIGSTSSTWTPSVSTPVTISGAERGVYPAVTTVSGTPLVAWTSEASDASVVRCGE